MQLADIALYNLRRRKLKALVMALGMVIGTAIVVTLLSLTLAMQSQFHQQAEQAGIRIMIRPHSEQLNYSYGSISVGSQVSYGTADLPISALAKVQKLDNLRVVAPKLLGVFRVHGLDTLVVGVDFPQELANKKYWQINGSIPQQSNQILMGNQAAKRLAVKLGDQLKVAGQSFRVQGIIQNTGAEEDEILFMNLEQLQALLNKPGTLSFIDLVADKNQLSPQAAATQMVDQITKLLPGTDVVPVFAATEARQELTQRFTSFALIISILVIIIGSLIILTTMMSAIKERTRELGILRAIGFQRSHIMQIILLETGLISFFSTVIGYLVGMAAAILVAPLMQLTGAVPWNPLLALLVLIVGLAGGILAGWYPALQAAKLDPVEALRFI